MTNVRKPAVSGMFYPSSPQALEEMVGGFIAEGKGGDIVPKALIAPHAGYIYSGAVAGQVYRLLKNVSEVKRVILLGPSHRHYFNGLALSSADVFETPLGQVPICKKKFDKLCELSFVSVLDAAHVEEHSLEVHLPFLQQVLTGFSIIPIVAGHSRSEQVVDVLELLVDKETVVVVSSDLSHYLDNRSARALDSCTSDAVERLAASEISQEQACGAIPMRGLLQYAKEHGLQPSTICLTNSGETSGDYGRVVGYGGWVFY